MNNHLALSDYLVFITYFILIASFGYWIYRRKQKASLNTKDFFLAEGSLTWWAIGASLIASNISAEQFIGMSGEGFFVGIAVAAYEWIAAVALIIIAIWFIPIYLKNKIYTMPQFLKMRYNETVALIMAVFWLFLYVFVNLTSILYLGAVAINGLAGGEYLHAIMLGLAIFALIITLGGMKVIGYTDVIQVAVLIIGGLATTYLALTMVSEKFGLGSDALAGFKVMMKDAPEHFKMILPKPTAASSQLEIDRYVILPGIAMYFAGQWIVNLNYWGCNQYITQRALGADLETARTGILFAGFLKLMMPLIVWLPGVAAYVLYKNGHLPQLEGGSKDGAYSAILGFLPNGLKGLSIAALTAAIVASLAGKANSISTIFTLDIYKKYFDKDANEKKLVWVGRATIWLAMLIAVIFTWEDLLGIGGEGGFTFIQKYTGFISPGVFAMFILGMFWKRTTGVAAIAGVLTGFLLSVFFNSFAVPMFGTNTFFYTAYPDGKGGFVIPFLICMGLSFLFTMIVMVLLSLAGPKVNPKAFELDKEMFKLKPSTIVLIVLTLMILTALYAKFW
ncbi:sodium:solute symporter family transporter [Chitinophaga niabensis]|uniref:Solute:Na+ symporter, SSS family n=1 Tax=Chitinophaga niabensis TaxID=536979 RepID=A0A1N6DAC7_9BACT|nr:sodium/solute symporter [Chitinophaga niabensis]SIN67750.1 solute:Na+ symporter, SSS family [Chitinophaga niabensis]